MMLQQILMPFKSEGDTSTFACEKYAVFCVNLCVKTSVKCDKLCKIRKNMEPG